MPLQMVLDGLDLTGGGRTESPVLVAINQELVLNVQNHIRVVVAVDIHERERDWDHIRAGIIELWPNVDARFRGVSAGKLDDFKSPVEV